MNTINIQLLFGFQVLAKQLRQDKWFENYSYTSTYFFHFLFIFFNERNLQYFLKSEHNNNILKKRADSYLN